MTLVSTVGGASGPLYGTAFLRAAGKAAGKSSLELNDFLDMMDAAIEGVKMRGKATVGEQTMLDAMVPALEAMKAAAPAQALAAGLAAAQEGMKATIPMVATKGRASYLGERSIGHQALQMAPSAPVAAAGGLPDGGIGTDFERIYAAVESVAGPDGAVILFDMGSAIMTTEMVLEQFEGMNIQMADGPLVEGSIVAAISSAMGQSVEQILAAVRQAGEGHKL